MAAYHQTQLRTLLEHVRAGFAQLDAAQIDEFDLDELIHHYKRSAAELWKFCGSSGGQWQQAANALAYIREYPTGGIGALHGALDHAIREHRRDLDGVDDLTPN
jgi:hypothetical protein